MRIAIAFIGVCATFISPWLSAQPVPKSKYEFLGLDVSLEAGPNFGSTSMIRDSGGNVYVADPANHVIRFIPAAGGAAYVWTGVEGVSGHDNGDDRSAFPTFDQPSAVALDAAGAVYVADAGNYSIRRCSSRWWCPPIAGFPSGQRGPVSGGCGQSAQIGTPRGILLDPDGTFRIWSGTPEGIGRLLRARVHVPVLSIQPDDLSVERGAKFTLTVGVVPFGGRYDYSWFHGSTEDLARSRFFYEGTWTELVEGGWIGHYTGTATNTEQFFVRVSDACSAALTQTATVTVRPASSRRRAVGRH